jgi:PPOX class probable FMN-dependent enzyme
MSGEHEITSVAELAALVGEPARPAATKVRDRLTDLHREWLAASPFYLVATADEDGRCDVSPKGDPAGCVHVLDDQTVVIPDRPGNRRVDGWRNVLSNPHVGLLFLIPGRGDTLRINGRARLLRDAPWFDEMIVKGHRPALALQVQVEEVFFHCSKAFLRSRLWDPASWDPDAAPERAVISHRLERTDTPLDELRDYYGPSYAANLYG